MCYTIRMEKIRPILYGVADYAEIKKSNAWFVDRTAKIHDLEDIAHAALIEMKYVKAGDSAPTPEQLADIKAKAIDQFPAGRRQDGGSPYGEPPSRRRAGTTGVSPVALHRLVLVFHGGDCVLHEEV